MELLHRSCLLAFSVTLLCALAAGQSSSPRKFGVGLNYGGGQVDWRWSQKWMSELRAQTGSDSDQGFKTQTSVYGVRQLRFVQTAGRLAPVFGGEAALIKAHRRDSAYSASGYSVGAFGGACLAITRRLLFQIDVGPYFIHLREARTHVGRGEVDIVADAAMIFFL